MKLVAKLSNDARIKLGISKHDDASFTGKATIVTSDMLKAKRNPRTAYIVI